MLLGSLALSCTADFYRTKKSFSIKNKTNEKKKTKKMVLMLKRK